MTQLLESPVNFPILTSATWRASDEFVLRIAGMAIETAHELRFGDTTAWADAVLAGRADLATRGSTLSDALYERVSAADADDRKRLIALRRDVFNNRAPRDVDAARASAATLPDELGAAVRDWLDDRVTLDQLEQDGAGVLGGELDARRSALRRLAAHPRFRQGLILASPSLDTYLDGYLRAGEGPLSKRHRRVERSLLDYVFRIACKTSPFSSFTGVGLGQLVDDAPDVLVGAVDDHWTDEARVNVAVIGRIIEVIVADHDLLGELTVALTPGWSVDLDRVRFVRRSVAHGDDDATVSFDTVRDSLLFLRRNGTLRHVLGLLADRGDMRVSALVDQLRAATDEDVERCAEYVRALLRVGLLWLPELRIDVHAHDPLRAFGADLRALAADGREWAAPIGTRIDVLADLVASYAGADLPRRRSVLSELRAGLSDVFAALGRPDESLPMTLLFEDSRSTAAVVAADRQRWAEHVAQPLERVSELLPAFDLSLPGRLLLKGFFLARYGAGGRCEDVLRMIHEFGEDIYNEYNRVAARKPTYDDGGRFVPHENWLRVGDLDALSAARSLAVDGMRRLWTGHDGSDELVLPEALVDEVSAALHPFDRELRPQGFFLQLGGTQEQPEVVLNRATSGMTFSFSRFTHCFRDVGLAERVTDAARSLPPRGAVLAEIVGGLVHTNLNVHAPLTDHQLLCPAESSSFPEHQQLPLEDLYVLHDDVEDRLVLRSRRLGREIVPVYLGYLMPTALPETARTLLLFSPMGMSLMDLWGGVPAPEPVDGVTCRPRLRYRNVVLARRRWAVASADLPVRTPTSDDAAWLLAWRDWQHRHGLPDQVFVTLPGENDGTDPDAADDWSRRSKPSYLDFTSLFSLSVFDAHLQRCPGLVELDEMKPAEDELYVRSPEGRHVCELAVELTRVPDPIAREDLFR